LGFRAPRIAETVRWRACSAFVFPNAASPSASPCIELTRRIFAANRTVRRQNRCTITIIRVSLGRSPALSYSSRVAKMADHDPPYRPASCPPCELSITRSDILTGRLVRLSEHSLRVAYCHYAVYPPLRSPTRPWWRSGTGLLRRPVVARKAPQQACRPWKEAASGSGSCSPCGKRGSGRAWVLLPSPAGWLLTGADIAWCKPATS
jgi:hypothetical protein